MSYFLGAVPYGYVGRSPKKRKDTQDPGKEYASTITNMVVSQDNQYTVQNSTILVMGARIPNSGDPSNIHPKEPPGHGVARVVLNLHRV